jgi:segregation and condensation protein B
MSEIDPSEARLLALLEAVTFVSPEPVPLAHLAYALGETPERVRELADRLAAEFAEPHHGLMLRALAGGYQLITKPEHHQELRELIENLPPPAPLSKAAVEAAAIIAYKQPITAAQLQAIRGVRNSETLRTLLKRKIIAPAGRARTRGHPVQYKTTRRFLIEFGLQSLDELPSIEELQQRVGFPLDLEAPESA